MLKSILLTLWPFAPPRPTVKNETLYCPRCGGVWHPLSRSDHFDVRRITRHIKWSCGKCGRTFEEWETLALREERSGYAFA